MKLKTLVPALIVLSAIILFPTLILAQTGTAATANPLPPKDLLADVDSTTNAVILSWTAPFDTSVIGFNVYRKEDKSGSVFERINQQLLTATALSDRDVNRGKSYIYVCRSINADGTESSDSNAAGAPKMQMKTSATVSHMNKPARIASPGDVIKYSIDFANMGFGVAKNVVIVYAIPKGTTLISGTALCQKYKVKIAFYDEKAGKWLDQVGQEENISKVSFTVLDDVYPISKDKNDTASLKVMVNY